MEKQEQNQTDHRNQIGYKGIADHNRGFERQDRHTQDTLWQTQLNKEN